MRFNKLIVFISLALSLEVPSLARADAPETVGRWAEPTTLDYALTGGLAAGLLGLSIGGSGRNSPGPWTGGILFDDSIRDALRIGSLSGRQAAATVSDWGRNALIAAPFLLDPLGLALGRDRNPGLAWRIFMVDAQAFAVAGVLTQVTKVIVGRSRPYVRACAADPGSSDNCGSQDSFHSFFSGHTAVAVTGASLLCLNHGGEGQGLFGDAWADGATCAGAAALAVTTGVMRIATDAHYTTDVLTGALIGLLAGWYIPTRFHQPDSRERSASRAPLEHQVMVSPGESGSWLLSETLRF